MKVRIWYGEGHLSDIVVPSDKESELLFDHITRSGHGLPVTPGSFTYLRKMAKLHGENLEITEPRGTKRESAIDYSKMSIEEEQPPSGTLTNPKVAKMAFAAAYGDKLTKEQIDKLNNVNEVENDKITDPG